MRNVIHQSATFPAPAEELFNMYMDASLHSTVTGAPVTISEACGGEFRAFDGVLSGTILQVVRPSLIVQSWRSTQFKDSDPDSTLILSFLPESNGGRIVLVHLDVPDHDYAGVSEGWEKYYWTPWRQYLETQ
jgi:activator of HSP90 ATPase